VGSQRNLLLLAVGASVEAVLGDLLSYISSPVKPPDAITPLGVQRCAHLGRHQLAYLFEGVRLVDIAQNDVADRSSILEQTLEARFVEEKPKRLIGDRAYDSDPLDAELGLQSIEMIAPHRRRRQKPKTQDGRKLRRYKRRWKVERLFAWLANFRRLVVRYEHKVNNFLGFVHLGCIVILLRRFAGLV
jgi:transposase